MTFLFYFQPFLLDGYFITQNERSIRFMKKTLKRLCTGFLALATVVTALPTTPVHAESKQYWTESAERVGIIDGKQLVTFEELYDLSNPDEPKKVTEHKDIEDKGQTITFKEKPEEPEKTETPPTPEKPSRPSDSPKTGDNTNLYGLLALLLTSGAGLASIFFYKRCKIKKS